MDYSNWNNMNMINGNDETEIFQTSDVLQMLHNRFVVIIGDSIQRGIYKDLVLLLQRNRCLTQTELKAKGEFSFLGDELIEGGRKDILTNGTNYKEVRQYKTDVFLVRFYFVTRCYNDYMESILTDLHEEPLPDILIMNSCLWDITRYGRTAITDYKENLEILFTRFSECLPSTCLVIWNTTLPISSTARGGFLIPEVEYLATTLRLDILEANFFAQKVAVQHGFDVLDLHFYLRHNLHWRVGDGIHWDMQAHRLISNLLLTHICEAWSLPMPSAKRVTFGSYGSTAARNGCYQNNTQPSNSSATTDSSPQQFSFGVNYINFENLNNNWLVAQHPQQPNANVIPGFNQNSFDNINGNMPQLHWQPYQQNVFAGAVPVDSNYRHNPYNRPRRT